MGTSSSTVVLDYYSAQREHIQLIKNAPEAKGSPETWIWRFQGRDLELDRVDIRVLHPKETVDDTLDMVVNGCVVLYCRPFLPTLVERSDPFIVRLGPNKKRKYWFTSRDEDFWWHVAPEHINLVTIEANRGTFSLKRSLYWIN